MSVITRRQLLALVPAIAVFGERAFAQSPTIEIVRDPGCGCCLNWVGHLEKAGFKTTVTESADMAAIKDKHGIPQAARSCHTGVVNGYVIEGHVPADDIKRLLAQRPKVKGLAVAGMPLGSPGMESASGRKQAFNVVSFDAAGKIDVVARYAAS